MTTERRKILCFASYYLPGVRSGGPVRSLSNMSEWLGEEYDFRVVTRDRDLGEGKPYEEIDRSTWNQQGRSRAWYLSAPYWAPAPLRRLIVELKPDLLYFQSLLDPELTVAPLLLRRLGLIPATIPVLIAPRGELFPGALAQKRTKKAIFRRVAAFTGIYSDVSWHATDLAEANYLRGWCRHRAQVFHAANLPPRLVSHNRPAREPKPTGSLRIVWLSRISRKKNLVGAIGMLREVKAQVSMDIYGPLEDQHYWRECLSEIAQLPSNVNVVYCGAVDPARTVEILSRYDAFFFPTLGENFGHVLLEALLAGCPLVVSDRTPWRDLESSRVGFDLPLEHRAAFVHALERLATMGSDEFESWSGAAWRRGMAYCTGDNLAEPFRTMLNGAMAAR